MNTDTRPNFPVARIIVTALIVALLWTLLLDRDSLFSGRLGSDFGNLAIRFGWRLLAALIGAAAGAILNVLSGPYFNIALGAVRSTGFQFSDAVEARVRNTFILVFAVVAVALGGIFIK